LKQRACRYFRALVTAASGKRDLGVDRQAHLIDDAPLSPAKGRYFLYECPRRATNCAAPH
jgi:hypothetical protein